MNIKTPPRPLYLWLSSIINVAALVLNGVFGYLNYTDRRDMRAEQRMTRPMLNARATIQMMLVDAAKTGRPLTADEIRVIDRLYVPAEYDAVQK